MRLDFYNYYKMRKIFFISLILVLFSFAGITYPNRICLAQDKDTNIASIFELGMKAYEKGDTPTALKYFERHLEICRTVNYKTGVAVSLRLIGEIKSKAGEYYKALEYLNEALKIGREINNTAVMISALGAIGKTYVSLVEYNKAFEYFEEALKISKVSDNKVNTAIVFMDIGETLLKLGYYNEALAYLLLSLKVCREIDYEEGVRNALSNIGAVYFKRGEFNKALENFDQLLTMRISAKDKLGVADAFNKLGSVHSVLGNLNKASKYFDDSLKICKEADFKEGIATILMNKGAIYLRGRDFYKALECFNESMNICIDTNYKEGVASNLMNLGSVYNGLGEFNKALSFYSDSFKKYAELGYKEGMARNLLWIGRLYYRVNDYAKALEYANDAIIIANQMNSAELIWLANLLLGISSEEAGNNASALSYYKTSIDAIESIRKGIKLEEYKIGFIEDKIIIYERVVLLLLKLGKKEEAFDYVERAKSRALLDLMANKIKPKKASTELSEEEKELGNRIDVLLEQLTKESSKPKEHQRGAAIAKTTQELGKLRTRHQEVLNGIRQKDPEFASLLSVEPLKSAEVTSLLDKDTTLLEYYVTENRLIIWILNDGKLDVAQVTVKEQELTNDILALRESIENRTDNYKEIARKLYKLLIEPAKPHIKTNRVCIVPHKALHYLSFSALLDNDRFFVEDYDIFYSPNASLLKFCFDKRKPAINNLLAFGNPDNSLENSEIEVSRIKKDFSKSDVFIREAATESRAKELTNNYNIVHFACHGELNPISPLYSHLKLAKDAQQDGRLEVWEIYEMDLNSASLITLSACKTALGNITNGDEIIGLTRGFIYAGSPSIVASLWDIDDVSTSTLMQEFYSNLRSNHSKTESLRLAQLKLINDKSKDVSKERGFKLTQAPTKPTDPSHPYYWAAFVLIGDWR